MRGVVRGRWREEDMRKTKIIATDKHYLYREYEILLSPFLHSACICNACAIIKITHKCNSPVQRMLRCRVVKRRVTHTHTHTLVTYIRVIHIHINRSHTHTETHAFTHTPTHTYTHTNELYTYTNTHSHIHMSYTHTH